MHESSQYFSSLLAVLVAIDSDDSELLNSDTAFGVSWTMHVMRLHFGTYWTRGRYLPRAWGKIGGRLTCSVDSRRESAFLV